MKINKKKAIISTLIGLSSLSIGLPILAVACNNKKSDPSSSNNQNGSNSSEVENNNNNNSNYSGFKEEETNSNLKYVVLNNDELKNDARLVSYENDKVLNDFLERMKQKRQLPSTKIKSTFEVSKHLNENLKTDNEFAYNNKNIFVSQPNEIPAWFYDSFFSKDAPKLTELLYKLSLVNPKTTTVNNENKNLSYFLRTEILNQRTAKMEEIFFRTPLYVEGWYVTNPMYDFDLQKGRIREMIRIGDPKSQNDAFDEIYLIAEYDGMKPTIAKKFNFTEYLHDSNELEINKTYEFEIEIKNKTNPLITQKQTFSIKMVGDAQSQFKQAIVSYLEFNQLPPGDYEMTSLKLKENSTINYAKKEKISLPFSLKVFSETDKLEPVIRFDINKDAVKFNKIDEPQILVDLEKFKRWYEQNKDEDSDYLIINNKTIKELTPKDFDSMLISHFINQDNDYTNIQLQYEITNLDKKNQSFDISAKYINTSTNKEYTSTSIKLRYSFENENKQTSVGVFEEYNDSVKDWETKLKDKLKTLPFEQINEESINDLLTITYSDLPINANTKTEFIKNNDKSITIKVYSDRVYINNHYFEDLNKDFLINEITINYYKNL